MNVLGIDLGGTGIKAAPVDPAAGTLVSDRFRVPTPQPSTPQAVGEAVQAIVEQFEWQGPIGFGFPGVVKHGWTLTAANVHEGWVKLDAKMMLQQMTSHEVFLLNDADAAGLAEMRFGAGRDVRGVVLVITVGTGIGTALFSDGSLLPNTELGHIIVRGREAEHRASERVRIERELSWKAWGKRLSEYLSYMEALFWPDLIILGGGVSKNFVKFAPYLHVQAPVVPAQTLNNAGVIGAAVYAYECMPKPEGES